MKGLSIFVVFILFFITFSRCQWNKVVLPDRTYELELESYEAEMESKGSINGEYYDEFESSITLHNAEEKKLDDENEVTPTLSIELEYFNDTGNVTFDFEYSIEFIKLVEFKLEKPSDTFKNGTSEILSEYTTSSSSDPNRSWKPFPQFPELKNESSSGASYYTFDTSTLDGVLEARFYFSEDEDFTYGSQGFKMDLEIKDYPCVDATEDTSRIAILAKIKTEMETEKEKEEEIDDDDEKIPESGVKVGGKSDVTGAFGSFKWSSVVFVGGEKVKMITTQTLTKNEDDEKEFDVVFNIMTSCYDMSKNKTVWDPFVGLGYGNKPLDESFIPTIVAIIFGCLVLVVIILSLSVYFCKKDDDLQYQKY